MTGEPRAAPGRYRGPVRWPLAALLIAVQVAPARAECEVQGVASLGRLRVRVPGHRLRTFGVTDLPIAIRPGAFVEVRVPDREYQNVARLPASAVFDGDTVYAIEKGRLVARKIEVVGTDGSDILVSGELAPGEEVMMTRLSVAGPGIKVRVR